MTQQGRRHVFVVNHAPGFLGFVRVLLQSARYNVTTTNLVPSTHAMIAACCPDAVVLNLSTGQEATLALLEGLDADPLTAQIPVVLTATDEAMLDKANALAHRPGGRFLLVRPFRPADLIDAIHALIGPA